MSAGPKPNSKRTLAPRPLGKIPDRAATVDKGAASFPDASTKSDNPEHKTGFAQATIYRQGVLVPRGTKRSTMPRTRSR